MLDCSRLHGTSDTQSLFELCSSRGKKKSFMTIKCVSLFGCESCLPMLPCVYLWMKMTLETPCTPFPPTTHISFILCSIQRLKWKYKVIFKETPFIIHGEVNIEGFKLNQNPSKCFIKILDIWFYDYLNRRQVMTPVGQQTTLLCNRSRKASVLCNSAVEYPFSSPHTHYKVPD